MFVLINGDCRFLAALRHVNRQDFFIVEAGFEGGVITGLALGGEAVDSVAAQALLTGDVVSSLRHGVATELRLNARVREARANGAVEGAEITGERRFAFGHNKGRTAHALGATSDKQFAFVAANRACRIDNGGEA